MVAASELNYLGTMMNRAKMKKSATLRVYLRIKIKFPFNWNHGSTKSTHNFTKIIISILIEEEN